jgi:glycosyltransferase involved in cell wall biosynthesis
LKILVAHDWASKFGGAEKVTRSIVETFPDSKLCTLWRDPDSELGSADTLQIFRPPKVLKKQRSFLVPFFLIAWRRFRVPSDVRIVIASSHLFAHAIKPKTKNGRKIKKFTYCHTPARYIWVPELDRRGNNILAKAVSKILRPIDKFYARESDLACNSEFVQQRIKDCWGLDSRVIYPPVDVDLFRSYATLSESQLTHITGIQPGFVLAASRFVKYKNLDIVIRAAAESGDRLVVAGQGSDETRLRKVAAECGGDVTFVISPSNQELGALFSSAKVYVFPAIEDFGIMVVEAMASGTPVIVNDQGGARESLIAGKTGTTFQNGNIQSLVQCLKSAEVYSPKDCIGRAQYFSKTRFSNEIIEWLGPAIC